MQFQSENLKQSLTDQVALIPKVRIIRSGSRLGLMKARMMGAVNAQGPALIFMDSHIEVTTGWLEPLLDRLAINKNITSMPVIHTIGPKTLHFLYSTDPTHYQVIGFTWDMNYSWKNVFESEGSERRNLYDPVSSPAMLGAFFGEVI